ncbi:ketoacyl-ACP synthase III [Streptomyces coacervatus]|uniref:Beta-ketoacyl-[acyl-carrier-protein] synthase III n=1 Tax=Streptomyces coacervatus TaxID=647381 RepID=A0ABP7HY95_9ACTN|nr:beta-ketoacyl-ACP synthase 3 [Streptomyces coacervatus]MDF2267149.1 beta-ketoacyl-ACP synthase 3 [Streptomyces coacervatus]
MTKRLTASSSHFGPALLGVGSYRPRRVVDNDEICRNIDSSDEWIRSRTGIVSRRWAGADESIADMAELAAEKALAAAGVLPQDVDCVIVATFTHLKQTPAVAAEIAHRIGAVAAAAFDISAGCAGFVHGLALAADTVRSRGRHVLVVGAERMTDLLDREDRSTAFIFGDGAGAVVLGPAATSGVGPVVWGADGSQADAISQTVPWDAMRDAPDQRWPALRQDGQKVFRWAVYEMAKVARQALDAAGLQAGDLDAFIPHQANVRIIDGLARGIGLPGHVVIARDIVTTGNTSGASIPLAMDALLGAGEVRSGGLALLLGYGAGLSYAATVVELP